MEPQDIRAVIDTFIDIVTFVQAATWLWGQLRRELRRTGEK